MTEIQPPPRRIGRSIVAIVVGFVVCAGLSVGTDVLLYRLGIFPSPDKPMTQTNLLLLALGYRMIYDGLGSYIAAWLAPSAPMFHALLLGGIGQVLSVVGAATHWNFGPNWYPVALAISVMPTAWLGGWLYTRGLRSPALRPS